MRQKIETLNSTKNKLKLSALIITKDEQEKNRRKLPI